MMKTFLYSEKDAKIRPSRKDGIVKSDKSFIVQPLRSTLKEIDCHASVTLEVQEKDAGCSS
jgi:hypothetical protein